MTRTKTRIVFSFLAVVITCGIGLTGQLQAQEFNDSGKLDPFIDLNDWIRETQPEVFIPDTALPPLSQRPLGLAGLAISELIVTGLAVGENSRLYIPDFQGRGRVRPGKDGCNGKPRNL